MLFQYFFKAVLVVALPVTFVLRELMGRLEPRWLFLVDGLSVTSQFHARRVFL